MSKPDSENATKTTPVAAHRVGRNDAADGKPLTALGIRRRVQNTVDDLKNEIDRRYDDVSHTLVLAAVTAATRKRPVGTLLAAAAIVFLVTHAFDRARAARHP